ncbi:class I SAM-dependent methyltransferase [Hyalangium versicolor]|uniref:class I SAM-dependent methyltransferase n=1 Tax=Hyalangium versicolor TaxID=2861190 RepID=UPI001CC9CA82|nr:SAM-dependent methyltransferase [Hyalangium versicolor]
MTDRSPSKTAAGVALLRAAHQLIDGEPKVLTDPIAAKLIEPTALAWLSTQPAELQMPASLALRSHVVTRSRFAEDRLQEAVARGVRQYVLLGAGLDSFAYRQPAWAAGLRIFEVDHPASQQEKQARLRNAGIVPPENLVWAGIDFERTSLREGLLQSGFDPHVPAFMSCLGVLVYLEEAAVHQVFTFVGSLPPSSEIVFTFTGTRQEVDQPALPALASRVESLGEPFRSHLFEEDLVPKLTGLGFSEVTVLTPEQSRERYFQGRSDRLPAPRRARIASARV